jgi:hypothetical protein
MNVHDLEKALAEAFSLGQRYWEYADSENIRDHKKADDVMEKYQKLMWRVCNQFIQETNQ